MSSFYWIEREPPLAPVGMLAEGAVARALADRLLALTSPSLAALSGVVTDDRIFVVGSELPWVDGATYFGRPQLGGALLLPTTRGPNVPDALFVRALARQGVPRRAAVWGEPLHAMSLEALDAIDRAALDAWRCK